ncbi:MAG: Hpt domain-containing protein [Pseudomonadales bacterium]|nr:Hpt domain-containing protein [Pseudomonadales bacterium]MDG2036193.1 Hpt domain-containing protein [Pseudomonadales bacterium]
MIEATAPINFSALDTLKLVLGTEFPALLHDFNQHCRNDLIKLEMAIVKLDRAAIRDIAHTLKGSALSLHAKPLADFCSVLEADSMTASTTDLDQHATCIGDSVKETISALDSWAFQKSH